MTVGGGSGARAGVHGGGRRQREGAGRRPTTADVFAGICELGEQRRKKSTGGVRSGAGKNANQPGVAI
jgi:hypothetical protein